MKKVSVFAVSLVFLLVAACVPAGCGGATGLKISSITPDEGPPMTLITISGSGFGDSCAGNKVEFNGNAIGIKTWSDNGIVATVPKNQKAGNYNVTVVTGSGTSQGYSFEVTEKPPAGNPPPDSSAP